MRQVGQRLLADRPLRRLRLADCRFTREISKQTRCRDGARAAEGGRHAQQANAVDVRHTRRCIAYRRQLGL